MKTLDEVIERLEDDLHATDADSQLIMLFDRDVADALYYLKMYRSDMQMYSENQKYWEDELKQKIKDFGDAKERYIKRLKELEIGTLNPPLTWDELKAMEGEPVWVESHRFGNHWYLNRGIKDESCFYFVGHYGENVLLYSDDIGKLWQAYRKKRNE